VGRGSVVGISLLFFSKTREMACGWEVEFGQKKLTVFFLGNGVSLDVGWKMIYSVIQRLDGCAQLAGWVAYYFAIKYSD
jgi:hypothetical protein